MAGRVSWNGLLLFAATSFALVSCGPHSPPEDADATTHGTPGATVGDDPTTGLPAACVGLMPIEEAQFPQAIAVAVCQRRAACGCAGADAPECGQDYVAHFEETRTYAQQRGLVYDGECLARRLHDLASIRCTGDDPLPEARCGACRVYSGPAETGELCELPHASYAQYDFVHTCAEYAEHCTAPVVDVPVEERCMPPFQEGDGCYGTADCAAGLACSFAVCVSADEGKPCPPYEQFSGGCAFGFYCEGSLCRQQRPVGASCSGDFMCESLRCLEGACVDQVFVCELALPRFSP